MAKTPKPADAPKVPEAELVGDHAQIKPADSGTNADAGNPSPVTATATGETAPVANNSTGAPEGTATGATALENLEPQTGSIAAVSDQGNSTSSGTGTAFNSNTLAFLDRTFEAATRIFVVSSPIRLDNILYAVSSTITLTKTQFDQLSGCLFETEWDEGED